MYNDQTKVILYFSYRFIAQDAFLPDIYKIFNI